MTQETLEEAAKRYANMHQDVSEELGIYLVKAVFQDGAKWQSERMYSEEEVSDLLKCLRIELNINKELIDIDEWFNKLKK